jgi:hypothetical protein
MIITTDIYVHTYTYILLYMKHQNCVSTTFRATRVTNIWSCSLAHALLHYSALYLALLFDSFLYVALSSENTLYREQIYPIPVSNMRFSVTRYFFRTPRYLIPLRITRYFLIQFSKGAPPLWLRHIVRCALLSATVLYFGAGSKA